ncbi:hypothetical protein IQ244_27550, partial [Nostoc sp. LEGE 06077]|uniref:hypothetical protein n=1 Tax=Nostoc sp. LEGE 06077 TaxID=915325 RepID=UPI0018824E0E
MTENLTTGFASEPSAPNLNLGVKRPLLPHKPFVQKLISPKFLSLLGAKPLSNFDPSVFLNSGTIDTNLLDSTFENSPFFSESNLPNFTDSTLATANKAAKTTSNSTTIQQKLETNNSVVNSNILSKNKNSIDINLAQLEALVDISIPSTSSIDPTVIQAQRDNNNSIANPKIESLSTTSPGKNATSNSDLDSKVIQTKLQTSDSISHQPAIASTVTESKVIQTKQDSNDSIANPKIESLSTTSPPAENDTSNTNLDSKVIQTKLQTSDSISHQP